jgi:hypothetical protein
MSKFMDCVLYASIAVFYVCMIGILIELLRWPTHDR